MNDIGQAAGGVIEALKAQPLSLALVVMNIALLAFLFYYYADISKQRNAYMLETQKLLARCVTVDELERLNRLK